MPWAPVPPMTKILDAWKDDMVLILRPISPAGTNLVQNYRSEFDFQCRTSRALYILRMLSCEARLVPRRIM